jgi:plastocyanin
MKKYICLTATVVALFAIAGCTSYSSQPSPANQTPASNANPSVPTSTPDQTTPTSTAVTPAVTTPTAPSETTSAAINIENYAFNPATVTIAKGATVTWTNNDSTPHQIKSDKFNSDLLSQGQSFSFTFAEAGTYDYSCSIHPSMTGTIIVQ